jgi:uncharacterized protein YhdP
MATPDIRADVMFDAWLSRDRAPLMSLSARVRDGRVAAVPAYLPAHIMSEGSVSWLDKAFAGGRITQGRMLLHGRLDSFPFRNREGRFEVALDTEDVTLHYRDDWPELSAVAGEVHFAGPGMAIRARRARMFGARLHNTLVAIEEFRRPVLTVAGEADADVGDVLQFLQASPLSQQVGGALASMQGAGQTRIDLALGIPLSKAVAESVPLSVEGALEFRDSRLTVIEGVALSELRGAVNFSGQKFEAPALTARLFGEPVALTVFTREAGDEPSRTVIAAQGHADAEALQQAFGLPLLQHLQGDSDWQVRVDIARAGTHPSSVTVHSTLEGMAVELPAPAAKIAAAVRPFTLTWQLPGREQAPTHRVRYGEVVSAIWQQQREPSQLQRLGLSFGAGDSPVLPQQPGIYVTGRLERFAPREWAALYPTLFARETAPREMPLPVELAMERLQLQVPQTQTDGSDGGAALHTADVPPLGVSVEEFAYGDMELGKLTVAVQPQQGQVMIDTLRLASRDFSLDASGRWVEGGATHFDLKFDAGDFGRMMRGLGFASIIRGGKTQAYGSVFWPGSPAAFALRDLGGEVHVGIEEGVIEEFKPGAGKLLGLLSLQALPRRLFLDFSDLAEQGLQFTSIEGDIRFEEGSAYTQNLHLKSLPANMLVTGRTGLVAKDYDQLIAVVPNVSDTVSVAGALAWGPQVAAVLLVLQKVFQSDIDAATMTRYELTGSWDKPVLTKLEPLTAAPDEEGGQ